MKFSTRHDTDLPAEALFGSVCNFPKLERVLLRRGATLRRSDGNGPPTKGSAWDVNFDWRGKGRELALQVTELRPPEVLAFSGVSDQFNVAIQIMVVALTRSKSRLIFEVDVQPRGMKARLMLQTAKLGKSQLDRKFSQRIGEFVNRISADAYS